VGEKEGTISRESGASKERLEKEVKNESTPLRQSSSAEKEPRKKRGNPTGISQPT